MSGVYIFFFFNEIYYEIYFRTKILSILSILFEIFGGQPRFYARECNTVAVLLESESTEYSKRN